MVDVKLILSLLADNVERTGYPVPIDPRRIYSWAEPLKLPRRGRTVLYTGALYQLVPYINSLVRHLESLERRKGGGLALKLAKTVSRVVDLGKIVAKADPGEVSTVEKVLKSIANLLSAAGVKYGYLYENDLYSGVLLYDMGLDEAFRRHAGKVAEALKRSGASLVITVDPHTTHVLRKVFPEYVEGFEFEVKSYLEVLAEKGGRLPVKAPSEPGYDVVLHDPCFYARHEGVIEQPRRLLALAGLNVKDPAKSGRMTYCCGGPVEAISPSLSKRIAETRLDELRAVGGRIVTMCPICYANLRRAGGEVEDIALHLSRRLLGA